MTHRSSIKPVFVSRQPIFNEHGQILGFALRFRGAQGPGSPLQDVDAGAADLLRSALVDIGVDHLVGDRSAFLVLPSHFLDSHVLSVLPTDQTVLELLPGIVWEDGLADRLGRLKADGFRIGLTENQMTAGGAAASALASVVRMDVRERDSAELRHQAAWLRGLGIDTLADHVDTEGQSAQCRSLGFTLYQGSYLSYPNIVKGHRLGSSEMVLLRLLEQLQWPDTTDDQIERLVTGDAGLSIGVLKLVNSPRFRRGDPIESVRHSLKLLGRALIGRWALLLALGASSGNGHAIERTLIRARMGYLMAEVCGCPEDAERFFTMGLLSGIDRLFGVSLTEILRQIKLSPEMNAALLDRRGAMGRALDLMDAFETAAGPLPTYSGATPDALSGLYLNAIRWARTTLNELAEGV